MALYAECVIAIRRERKGIASVGAGVLVPNTSSSAKGGSLFRSRSQAARTGLTCL